MNSFTITFFDKFFNLQTDWDVSSENIISFLNSSEGIYNISFSKPICTSSPSALCPIPSISSNYAISFFVTRSGSFALWIASHVSGKYLHLRGSPFSLSVLPAIACGTLTKVAGSGLSIATAGVSATYRVTLKDTWGNIPNLSQNIVCSFVTLSGAYDVSIQQLDQNSFKTTKGGSNFLYAFAGTSGGLFATFWSRDFSTRRSTSVTSLDFSSNYDSNLPLLTNFGSRFSGFLRIPFSGAFTFSVNLVDATEKFNMVIDHLTVLNVNSSISPRSSYFQAARGPNAFYYIEVEYASGVNLNSRYTLTWSFNQNSQFNVIMTEFLYFTSSISGSPFALSVMPGPLHSTFSSCIGSVYSIITAGTSATFTITLKDSFNNIVGQDNQQIIFDILPADRSVAIPPVDTIRSSCLDSIGSFLCPLNSINAPFFRSTPGVTRVMSSNGMLHVAFSVTKSGKYLFRSRLFRNGGLASEYYNTMDFKSSLSGVTYTLDQMAPSITRIDETPSNDWGFASPSPANIPVDHFSVRYRGYILGPCSCAVNIVLSTDFGVRVFVNGRRLIDQIPSLQSQISVSVDFLQGSLLPIILEYVHNSGPSKFNVAWTSSNGSLTEIPSSSFYFDASIGKLSQYISVLPSSPIWSLPFPVKSLTGFIATAGVPITFSVRSTDSYGNPVYSFDSSKIFGKWNFPLYNVSGMGTVSVAPETTTLVSFSSTQSFLQGTQLYAKFSSNEPFFIGTVNSSCISSLSCFLSKSCQIAFSNMPFYYIQNSLVYSSPITLTALGDFDSPFNGLTATYFSPHTSKFSTSTLLYPVKVLCQQGSFFDSAACDQTLDFSHPIPNGIISSGSATFGVRWSGLLLTQTRGIYTIYGITSSPNEYVSLKVNGTTLFSEVSAGFFATISAGAASNSYHDIIIEYQKTSSSSTFLFQLKWKGPGISLSVVPNNVLFPLGSRFSVSSISTLSNENISHISIGSVEAKGLSSTFYSDISGATPLASLTYETLELK
jgi:hypothetical protein